MALPGNQTDIRVLEPLVGDWTIEARIPSLGDEPIAGRVRFAWTLDGAALLEQGTMEHPDAPDSLSVIAPDGDAFLQHYFDTRGVVRLYRMTFDGSLWTLQRDEPDFSELSFHQRFLGTVTGDRIDARWETSPDGEQWELDFTMLHRRA